MKIKNKLGNFIQVPGAVANRTYRGWGSPFKFLNFIMYYNIMPEEHYAGGSEDGAYYNLP